MSTCRLCAAKIAPFLSFGQMPIANGFLAPPDIPTEYFFDLAVAHCARCSLVQLVAQPDPTRMFHEQYAFYTGTSQRMIEHFGELASNVQTQHLASDDPFVVEIGSNDGTLLTHFAQAGVRHLGIEPSANVAAAAREKNISTECAFFTSDLANNIRVQHGAANVILATNVLCHLPDLHDAISGMAALLAPDGVIITEDPYLGDILAQTAFDQFYDEHLFYFSLTALRAAYHQHGLEVIGVEPIWTHGGSIRVTAAHRGAHAIAPRVQACLAAEEVAGLLDPDTFLRFRHRCQSTRDALRTLLRSLHHEGKRVVGYAATSKSTTVANYCRLGPDLVEYICDTTPTKQGKVSPGAHIPIRPHADFLADTTVEYTLLFGWNHREEIFAKEAAYRARGGKWILYVPSVQVQT